MQACLSGLALVLAAAPRSWVWGAGVSLPPGQQPPRWHSCPPPLPHSSGRGNSMERLCRKMAATSLAQWGAYMLGWLPLSLHGGDNPQLWLSMAAQTAALVPPVFLQAGRKAVKWEPLLPRFILLAHTSPSPLSRAAGRQSWWFVPWTDPVLSAGHMQSVEHPLT